MKILLIVFLFIANMASGQTWQEWTRQKKTQIKYLLQQVAANKVYLAFIKEGYTIAHKGLNNIRTIKDGDFKLHSDFVDLLRTVNPVIKDGARVADIINLQLKIIQCSKQAIARAKELDQFTPENITYCSEVFDNLLDDCLNNMDELYMVITDAALSMKDDERMKRIDTLYADMQNKIGFCASFSNEMDILSIQRRGEQMEFKRSKDVNGLP